MFIENITFYQDLFRDEWSLLKTFVSAESNKNSLSINEDILIAALI